ncbi:hypothetical protein BHF72_2447 [Cloacibacterium normanense]|uniref:Uncharacterized protein n=1 Tax=Cloacibacterium normanense TaxID=237258 RepID=A0A1E5UDU9_9FLAO|nr:hypothetical protein BHF72_2447 [Cloacibacterium normanense]SDO87615.1 hypothetical protein SAMN04489756_12420 [Cloacibacterium normanense]
MSAKRIIQIAKDLKISPESILDFLIKENYTGLTLYSSIN